MKCVCWETSPSLPARKVKVRKSPSRAVSNGSRSTIDLWPFVGPWAWGEFVPNIGFESPDSFSRRILFAGPHRVSSSSASRSPRVRFLLPLRGGVELLYSRVESIQYTQSFASSDDCGSTSSSLLQYKVTVMKGCVLAVSIFLRFQNCF